MNFLETETARVFTYAHLIQIDAVVQKKYKELARKMKKTALKNCGCE